MQESANVNVLVQSGAVGIAVLLALLAHKLIDRRNNNYCRLDDDLKRVLSESLRQLATASERLATLQEQLIHDQREARRELADIQLTVSRILDATRRSD